MHRANFIGLARSKCLCGGGVTTWGQAWGPRDRNVTKLAKTSTLFQNVPTAFYGIIRREIATGYTSSTLMTDRTIFTQQ